MDSRDWVNTMEGSSAERRGSGAGRAMTRRDLKVRGKRGKSWGTLRSNKNIGLKPARVPGTAQCQMLCAECCVLCIEISRTQPLSWKLLSKWRCQQDPK